LQTSRNATPQCG